MGGMHSLKKPNHVFTARCNLQVERARVNGSAEAARLAMHEKCRQSSESSQQSTPCWAEVGDDAGFLGAGDRAPGVVDSCMLAAPLLPQLYMNIPPPLQPPPGAADWRLRPTDLV